MFGKKKQDYLTENGLFAEDGTIRLRALEDTDMDAYVEISKDISSIKKIYDGSFRELTWQHAQENKDLILIAETCDDRIVVGRAVLMGLQDPIQEIGVSVLSKYRKKGYGQRMVTLLTERAAKVGGMREFLVSVYDDNYASRRMISKYHIEPIRSENSEFKKFMKALEEKMGYDFLRKVREEYGEEMAEIENRNITVYKLSL